MNNKKTGLAATFCAITLLLSSCGAPGGSGSDELNFKSVDGSTSGLPQVSEMLYSSDVGMSFGTAYDSISGVANSTRCIDTSYFFDEDGNPKGELKGSAKVDSYIEIINTQQDLTDSLNINANASLDIGVYSASASASYTKNVEMSSDKVIAVWTVGAAGPSMTLYPPDGEAKVKILNSVLEENDTFEEFYEECGDSYIATMTTGSYLKMILEISTSSSSEKAQITSSINGNGPAFKGEGSISSDLSSILNSSQTTIQTVQLGSVDCSFDIPDPDIDSFQAKVANYSKEIKECLLSANSASPSWWTVTVENIEAEWKRQKKAYEDSKLDDLWSGDLASQSAAMLALVTLHDDYKELMGDIDYMNNTPSDYDWTNSEYNQDTILEATNVITPLLSQIVSYAKECESSSYSCEDKSASIVPTPAEIRATLPTKASFHPTSCKKLKNHYPDNNLGDREYTLYLGGDPNKPITIWCQGMLSNNPTEYLTLPDEYQSTTSNLQYNYATLTNTWHWASGGNTYYGDVKTVYQRLPIKIRHNYIVIDDQNSCNNNPHSINWQEPGYTTAPSGCAKIGHAEGSLEGKRALSGYPGTTDISLYGTPWHFDTGVGFSITGSSSKGYQYITPDRKRAQAKVRGNNGFIAPSGELVLKLDE